LINHKASWCAREVAAKNASSCCFTNYFRLVIQALKYSLYFIIINFLTELEAQVQASHGVNSSVFILYTKFAQVSNNLNRNGKEQSKQI